MLSEVLYGNCVYSHVHFSLYLSDVTHKLHVSTAVGENRKISNLIKISLAVLLSPMPWERFTVTAGLTGAGLPLHGERARL